MAPRDAPLDQHRFASAFCGADNIPSSVNPHLMHCCPVYVDERSCTVTQIGCLDGSAPTAVILGLDPRIHNRLNSSRREWILGSSPRMTAVGLVMVPITYPVPVFR